MKSSNSDKDRDITQQLPSQAKQTLLGEISLICYQSNQSRVMRNKSPVLKHLLPTPPFLPGSTSLDFLPPPGDRCRGMGLGAVASSSHSFPALVWGPSVGDASLWTSPMWVLPMGCCSSRTAAAWVLSHPMGFRKRLLQHRLPLGSLHHPVLVWGPPWAAARSLLPCGPPWAAGVFLFWPWSASSPSSSLASVSAGLLQSHTHSSLPAALVLSAGFFPFPNT